MVSLQQSSLRSSLVRLEAEMEEFYTVTASDSGLRLGGVRRGELVAALHSDLAWHRARVLQAGTDWLLLLYLDWGWLAKGRAFSSSPTAEFCFALDFLQINSLCFYVILPQFS